jgi:hypothetical protein
MVKLGVSITMNSNHLNEQKLTYFQHLGRALKMAFKAGIAADILFIHAFFPFIFDNYFSRYIKRTHEELHNLEGKG